MNYGKSEVAMAFVECALRMKDKRMVIATHDTAAMLARLKKRFPEDEFVVEGEWYIRVVPR